MSSPKKPAWGWLFIFALALPSRALAYEINDDLEAFGYAQIWVLIHQQMQEADELRQDPSGDLAATHTSGLSINRARIGVRLELLDGWLRFFSQLKLERDPSLLDLAMTLHVARWLRLSVGQQKIPSSYENLTLSWKLDFIQRTSFSKNLADYSLSRTNHASSLFYGVGSNLRDLGISLKGELELGPLELFYFAMLGNGLGANLFIGGGANKEFIITNAGDFFYGGRLEVRWPEVVTLGGHVNYNRHDNIVFNSGRVVLDLNRLSASGDLQIAIPGTGLRLCGLAGWGRIDDDFDDDGRVDLLYWGAEGRLLWQLNPLLQHLWWTPFFDEHLFQLGVRYDNYSSEWNGSGNGSGNIVRQHDWTFGLTYERDPHIKLQLDVVLRRTEDPDLPDLDDNLVLLSVQGFI